MPTDADVDAIEPQGDGEDVEGSTPPAAATPSFGLSDVRTMIKDAVGEVMNNIVDRANVPQPVREDPEPAGATEEDFSNDIRGAVRKEMARALHPLRREMGQFREFGLSRLSELTERSMASQLPYYTKYEAEIRGELAKLNAAVRTDPATIRLIHDTVAMRHEGERIEEARTEGKRSARGDAPAPSNNNGRGRAATPDDVPTPEELGFSRDEVEQMEAIGGRGGLDEFADKVSEGRYSSWKEYVDSHTKMRTAPRVPKERGNVIPFMRGKVVQGVLTEDGPLYDPTRRRRGRAA